MIFVWAQHGYVVPAIVFLCSLLMELAVESWFHDPTIYQTEYWPLSVALIISGFACWFVGMKLNGKEPPQRSAGPGVIINGQAPQETSVKALSTFIFVRVEYWTYLLVAAALGLLFVSYGLPAFQGFP